MRPTIRSRISPRSISAAATKRRWRWWAKSRFEAADDVGARGPAVDAAEVVADQQSIAVYLLHDVEDVVSLPADEDHVVDDHLGGIDRLERDQLIVFDAAAHGSA